MRMGGWAQVRVCGWMDHGWVEERKEYLIVVVHVRTPLPPLIINALNFGENMPLICFSLPSLGRFDILASSPRLP
jgi:hypothetical protein